MEEAIELRGLRVQFVSYVDQPANDKKFFIVKSEKAKEPNVKKDVKILVSKDKEEKHLIYGVVYSPGEVDLQGEFMTAKEIQEASHQFLKDYRLVDKDHNNIPGAGEVVESHCALEDMVINGEEISKGSWILTTQPDKETWEEIQKGTYSGYSLYGFAKEKVKSEVKKSVWDKVKNIFGIKNVNIKKDFKTELENYRNNDFWSLFYIFEQAISKITWDNPDIDGEKLKSKIVKNLRQLISTVQDMTFQKVAKNFEISKPYSNEHSCRLKDPSDYEEFARKEREHDGKKYSVIYGIKEDDTSEEQAYRYNTDIWSEKEARKHCSEHDGTFHASSEDKDTKTSKSKLGEEMDEELKKEVGELVDSKIDEIRDEISKKVEGIGDKVKEAIKNAHKEDEDDNEDNDKDDDDKDTDKDAVKSVKKLKEELDTLKGSLGEVQKSILQTQQAVSDIDDDDDKDDNKKESLGLPSIL